MHKSKQSRVTLNDLKEEQYSLNMRWRLAIQTGDEQAKADVEKEMAEIDRKIRQMSGGGA